MNSYVFYINDISVNVYQKKHLTPELKKALREDGFHKMPFEAPAENESAATDLMLRHFKDNADMLKAFAEDNAISHTIFATLSPSSS